MVSWAAVSTPSATTSRESARPIPTTDAHSARACGSRSMRVMRAWSSFMMSMGSRVRWARAEAPTPKPDSATCTPMKRSVAMSSPTRSSSDVTAAGADLEDQTLRRQARAVQGALHVGHERAGGDVGGGDLETDPQCFGVDGSRTTAAVASVSVQRRSSPRRPARSAMERNSAGGISPRSGWRQRSVASVPVIRCPAGSRSARRAATARPWPGRPGGRRAGGRGGRQPRRGPGVAGGRPAAGRVRRPHGQVAPAQQRVDAEPVLDLNEPHAGGQLDEPGGRRDGRSTTARQRSASRSVSAASPEARTANAPPPRRATTSSATVPAGGGRSR